MEEYSEFFNLITKYEPDSDSSYYKIEELSKTESIKKDLIIFEKSIKRSCGFWKRNVFLTLTPEDELWYQAVNTFEVFDLVDAFARKVQYLKSNALNENQDLYLMLTKSKEFVEIIENSLNLISMLRMVPLNNIRSYHADQFDGDSFSIELAPWYFRYHKLPDTFLETISENLVDISKGNYEKIQTEILDTLVEDYFYDPEDSCGEEVSDRESMYHILMDLQNDRKLLNLTRDRYKEIQINKIITKVLSET